MNESVGNKNTSLKEDVCIIFKISCDSISRYVFFELETIGFEDLKKAFQMKFHIVDIEAYQITANKGLTVIGDDEDLYGVILEFGMKGNIGLFEAKDDEE